MLWDNIFMVKPNYLLVALLGNKNNVPVVKKDS